MNYNAIPIVSKKTYIKDEKDIYVLIADGKDTNHAIKVNSVGKTIINLCNSKNSINDIVENLQIIYNDKDSEKILNDVITFIRRMKKEDIIFCDMEDDMFSGEDIYEDEFCTIHRCGEADINNIMSIINNSEKNTLIGLEIYRNALLNKIYIRNQLFNFSEEYFILSKKIDSCKSENIFLALKNTSNSYINIYTISFINKPSSFSSSELETVINEAIKNLKNNLCQDCSKVKVNFPSTKSKELSELFLNLGFKLVGKYESEFGKGIDCLNYELIL